MKSMRRIALLVAALSALSAVALPVAASAARLETPAGSLVGAGLKFNMQSTNMTYTTSYGLLKCGSVGFNEEVIKNNGTIVEAVERSQGSSANCSIGGHQFTQKAELKNLKLEGPNAGTANLVLDVQLPGLSCHFEKVGAPVTYVSGGNVLRLTNVKMKGEPTACEPWIVNAEFSLTDAANGSPLILK